MTQNHLIPSSIYTTLQQEQEVCEESLDDSLQHKIRINNLDLARMSNVPNMKQQMKVSADYLDFGTTKAAGK